VFFPHCHHRVQGSVCVQMWPVSALFAAIYMQCTQADSKGAWSTCIYPSFIQLLDDDIVSLIGLTWLVKPSHKRNKYYAFVIMSQLSLSLYLTAQCQIKLRHSTTSLATTLDYVQLARARVKHDHDIVINLLAHTILKYLDDRLNDQLLLKFVEQKILRYISADQDYSRQCYLQASDISTTS